MKILASNNKDDKCADFSIIVKLVHQHHYDGISSENSTRFFLLRVCVAVLFCDFGLHGILPERKSIFNKLLAAFGKTQDHRQKHKHS